MPAFPGPVTTIPLRRQLAPPLHVLPSVADRPSAIALTLRAVGGLTTLEIANAFLVPEATMRSGLPGHYRLDAVRGHLYERAGDPDKALQHYRNAAAHTTSIPERDYLLARAARIGLA